MTPVLLVGIEDVMVLAVILAGIDVEEDAMLRCLCFEDCTSKDNEG